MNKKLSEYITNTEAVKLLGNLKNVDNNIIEQFFPQAKMKVVDITGTAQYNDLKDVNTEDRKLVAMAEGYFILSLTIPTLNIQTGGAGLVQSTGFNESKQSLMSINDVKTLCEDYERQAYDILSKYKLPDECGKHKVITESIKMVAI